MLNRLLCLPQLSPVPVKNKIKPKLQELLDYLGYINSMHSFYFHFPFHFISKKICVSCEVKYIQTVPLFHALNILKNYTSEGDH